MNLIIMLLTLTLASNERLLPNQQRMYSADIKAGYVHLQAKGISGDLDCYLLSHHPGHGWYIVARDENAGSQCNLGYYSGMPETIKIWLVNHSNQPMSYSATLSQE